MIQEQHLGIKKMRIIKIILLFLLLSSNVGKAQIKVMFKKIVVAGTNLATNNVLNIQFSDGSGTTALDLSPTGDNATLHGAAFVTGAVSYSNAGTDYVVLASDNAALSPSTTGNLTISVWVNIGSGGLDGNQHRIYNDYAAAGSASGVQVLVRQVSDNFQVVMSDGSNALVATTTTTLSTGTWYNIVVVKNGTNIKIYLNSNLEANVTNGSVGTILTSDGLVPAIGTYGETPSTGDFGFYGLLKKLRIYSDAKDQTFINALYAE